MMQNVEKITIPEIFVSRDDVQTDWQFEPG